jgi:RES domain-containing protein
MALIDPRLVARQPGTALQVTAYRNQAAGFDPRSGEGARRRGGRFNPPHSFPVLYLCLTRPCVVAELTRQAHHQGLNVADLLPRELWQIEATLDKVLDLTDDGTLAQLSLDRRDLIRDDYGLTQELGETAHQHGFQAVRTPSATGVDDVLAVFTENLAGARLAVELLQVWSTVEDLNS